RWQASAGTTRPLPFRAMPSGKKSKQMRRAASAPPPIQSKGGGRRRRQANPRVLMIGGGFAVLAIIGIVLGIVLSGGGSKSVGGFPTVGSPAIGRAAPADVEAQFKGIPQNGLTLGKPDAPVTLVEYIDLQC